MRQSVKNVNTQLNLPGFSYTEEGAFEVVRFKFTESAFSIKPEKD